MDNHYTFPEGYQATNINGPLVYQPEFSQGPDTLFSGHGATWSEHVLPGPCTGSSQTRYVITSRTYIESDNIVLISYHDQDEEVTTENASSNPNEIVLPSPAQEESTSTASTAPMAATFKKTVGTPAMRKASTARRMCEATHLCEMCGDSFTSKKGLRNHRNAHLDVKPYSCAKCAKLFRTRGNQNRHAKTQHDR